MLSRSAQVFWPDSRMSCMALDMYLAACVRSRLAGSKVEMVITPWL